MTSRFTKLGKIVLCNQCTCCLLSSASDVLTSRWTARWPLRHHIQPSRTIRDLRTYSARKTW